MIPFLEPCGYFYARCEFCSPGWLCRIPQPRPCHYVVGADCFVKAGQQILQTVKTVGVLAPGVRELAQTGKKRLGVIATATSIKSGSFQRELSALAPDAEVCALACPDFVPMIESGRYLPSDPEVRATVARSLSELKERKTEALLLGCTHYGLIADAIRDFLGDEVELIGAADAAARELCAYIEGASAFGDGGSEEYYTSGSIADFEALAPLMLGYELKAAVNHVPPFPLEVL